LERHSGIEDQWGDRRYRTLFELREGQQYDDRDEERG
jgi:hypothetical protein